MLHRFPLYDIIISDAAFLARDVIIKSFYQKYLKKKKTVSGSFFLSQPAEISFNPVYDNSPQEDEVVYTSVKKVRPLGSPISPVVFPAPPNLGTFASDLRPEEVGLKRKKKKREREREREYIEKSITNLHLARD